MILINEDNHRHMGVEVTGLDELNGRRLEQLYTSESATPMNGALITRMRPYEVQVFATSRKWETSRCKGRDFTE